jgi:protein TonB
VRDDPHYRPAHGRGGGPRVLCQNARMSDPTPRRAPLLPPRLLTPLAIAFAIGLVLFLLLWLDQRNEADFFKPGAADAATGADGEPLPAPLPADIATADENASGLRLPRGDSPLPPPAAEQPRLLEPPPPVAPMPAPQPPPGIADRNAPVPLNQPAPAYPQEALRRNAGGTVRIQAMVGPDGRVERLEVVQSSGNRHLDRAASEAVRRWTFRPATRNGQPVSGSVSVPISFDPAR